MFFRRVVHCGWHRKAPICPDRKHVAMKTSDAQVRRQCGVITMCRIWSLGVFAVGATYVLVATAVLSGDVDAQPERRTPLVEDSFENGLATPWGTGQYAEDRSTW